MSEPTRRSSLIAGLLSLGILVTVLLTARPAGRRSSGADTPTDLIYNELVPAMRAGDTKRYLACFDDKLRTDLRTAAESDGWDLFRESLKAQNARVTGVAVSNEKVSGNEASLRLEWVYREDSDVQQVGLRRVGRRWLIRSMSTIQRAPLPIPYGTEVIPGLRASDQGEPELPPRGPSGE